MRKSKHGEGLFVYIHRKLLFKRTNDLSASNDANKTLIIEILNKNVKYIIISICYRPPFKKHLSRVFDRITRENKKLYIVGDFNINILEYSNNIKVKSFINFMFSKGNFVSNKYSYTVLTTIYLLLLF